MLVMRLTRSLPALLAASAALAVAQEQPRDRNETRRQLRDRFEATGLKAGSAFPEVAIFDADGKPFNTRSLKGKYTVIVNGCLT